MHVPFQSLKPVYAPLQSPTPRSATPPLSENLGGGMEGACPLSEFETCPRPLQSPTPRSATPPLSENPASTSG